MTFTRKHRIGGLLKMGVLAACAGCTLLLLAAPSNSNAQVFSNGTQNPSQTPEPGCFNWVSCSFPVTLSSGGTATCGPQNNELAVDGAVTSGGDADSGTLCGAYQQWQLQQNGTMGWTTYYCGYDGPGNICSSN
jgi:hypothetical protein